MRVCVFGAGAVGGHLAVRVANSGNEVTVIARGATADAISQRGVTLRTPDKELSARPRVCVDAAQAGPQDLVFVAVKSMSIPAATEAIAKLRGADTAFVFIVNGIPWWYPHGAAAAKCPLPDLDYLDPGGRLAKALGAERVLGSVVYSGNEVVEPGIVKNHSAGAGIVSVGAPSPGAVPRVAAVRKLLEDAGFKSPPVADIRQAVWTKLITSNLAAFPICTLLNAPIAVFSNPELAALATAILEEGMAVARAHGIEPEVDPAKVYEPARMNNPHKPSMVQDFAKGRPLEIDGVLVAAQRFARAANLPMPRFDALMAVLVQRALEAGLYVR